MGDEIAIKGNFCEVAPEWKEKLLRSMEWIQRWYAGRMDYRSAEGLGIVSRADVYRAKDRLQKAWICANKGGAACIREALLRGELSLRASEEELAAYGLSPDGQVVDEAAFNKMFVLGEHVMGRCYPIFNAAVVFINTELFHQKQAEGLPMFVQDTLIHELTHGLERSFDERYAGRLVKEEDPYLDSGAEVYARLNEVRAHFQLDPSQAVTLETIQEMRRRTQLEKSAFKAKLAEVDRDKSAQRGALDPALFDRLPKVLVVDKVLSRYSDEELLMLLNETAMTNDPGELDREHAMALGQDAATQPDKGLGLVASREAHLSMADRPIRNGASRSC